MRERSALKVLFDQKNHWRCAAGKFDALNILYSGPPTLNWIIWNFFFSSHFARIPQDLGLVCKLDAELAEVASCEAADHHESSSLTLLRNNAFPHSRRCSPAAANTVQQRTFGAAGTISRSSNYSISMQFPPGRIRHWMATYLRFNHSRSELWMSIIESSILEITGLTVKTHHQLNTARHRPPRFPTKGGSRFRGKSIGQPIKIDLQTEKVVGGFQTR